MYKGYIRRICVTLHIRVSYKYYKRHKVTDAGLAISSDEVYQLGVFFVLALGPKITTMCFVDTRRIL